jgi:hypothetical protein
LMAAKSLSRWFMPLPRFPLFVTYSGTEKNLLQLKELDWERILAGS